MKKITTCLLAILLTACKNEPVAETKSPLAVRTVTVQAATRSEMRLLRSVILPGLREVLSFRVPGNIASLKLEVGDSVQAGSVLALLDDADYKLKLAQAEAEGERAKAAADLALSQLDRAETQYTAGSMTLRELQAAQTNHKAADAAAKAAALAIDLMRNQVSYTSLASTIDGFVEARPVEEGQNVQATQAIYIISSGKDLDIDLNVPDAIIDEIQMGDKVDIKVDTLPGLQLAGTIDKIGPNASTATHSYPVTIKLATRPAELKAGMAVSCQLHLHKADLPPTALFLPQSAVLVSPADDRTFVYVVSGGIARKQEVHLRKENEKVVLSAGQVEIANGLSPGAVVISKGLALVHDGDTVTLYQGE